MIGTKIEVIDEETAFQAIDLVEQGSAVSYSDKDRFSTRIDDADRLTQLLTHALMYNRFPIIVEAVT